MTAHFFRQHHVNQMSFSPTSRHHISVVDVFAVSEKLRDREGLEKRLAKETKPVAALNNILMVAASGFGVVVLRLG